MGAKPTTGAAKPAHGTNTLSRGERWAAAGLTVVLSILVVGVLRWTPTSTATTDVVSSQPTTCCTLEITRTTSPVSTTPVVTAVVALAAVCLLMTLNGMKLKTVNAGGAEVGFADEVASARAGLAGKQNIEKPKAGRPQEGTTPIGAAHEATVVEGRTYHLYWPTNVPVRVLQDLFREIAPPPSFALSHFEFVARRAEKGNQAWFFKVREDETIYQLLYPPVSAGAQAPELRRLA